MDRDQIGYNQRGAAGATTGPIPNTIAAKVEAISNVLHRCSSLAMESEMKLRGPMPEPVQTAAGLRQETTGLLDDLERIHDRMNQLERRLEGTFAAL